MQGAGIFSEVAGPGSLDVQLVYYRDPEGANGGEGAVAAASPAGSWAEKPRRSFHPKSSCG
jgi:hypothetical protein